MYKGLDSGVQSNDSLSFKDALTLTIQAGVNVDGHWRQFYAYMFGLLAWLSSQISKFGELEAWALTVATAGFFSINAIAMIRAYVLLNLLIAETNALAMGVKFQSEYVNSSIRMERLNVKLPMRLLLTALANIGAAGTLIHLVWKYAQK